MERTRESRTLTVRIERAPTEVAAFVAEPANLPRWASGLGDTLERIGGRWIVRTPQGPMTLRFAAQNALGVLDHDLTPVDGGDPIHVSMRVIPNGGGSEVLFTLVRAPGMTDAQFEQDAACVRRDLDTLRHVMDP